MMEIKSKEIEMVPVSELIHHPKNMNVHSDDQINRLVKLIEYQGFRNPLVVQRGTNLVVAGNGRLMAAKKIGLAYVPVTYQEFDSEAQLYAYMTSDNAIASWAHLDLSKVNTEMLDLGPDFDIDMLGIKDFVLEPIEKFEALTDEDAVPEVVHPITRRGDIWLLGNHRLMCGDSTSIDAVEKLMNGTVPNAVITDPPYGIGIDGQKKSVSANPKHNRKHHEKKGWDAERPDASIFGHIVSLGVPAVIWGGNYFADLLPATRGWIYWSKGQDGLTMSDGELAWTTEDKPLRSKTVNRAALKGSVHPTQKPAEIIEFSADYLSVPQKGAVLDLFAGSGTICIVCEKTDRRAFMMERDAGYCDVIIKRWMNFTGKKATLELTGQTYEELKQERDNGPT